jgi:hypothetical protein
MLKGLAAQAKLSPGCRPLLILAVFLPVAVWPEGAVKLLQCEFIRVCDAAGNCAPEDGRISFRMEPDDLGAGGAGKYSLSYQDNMAQMQAVSDSGPFLWNLGSERNALIASSENEWLWHSLTLEPVPGSDIRFLRCSFQQ